MLEKWEKPKMKRVTQCMLKVGLLDKNWLLLCRTADVAERECGRDVNHTGLVLSFVRLLWSLW